MTVKETILLAADELGCGNRVREYFEEEGETGKKETEVLLRCFNLVENELALDYLPLYAEDEAESETARSPIPPCKGRPCAFWACGTNGEIKFPSGSFPTT